MSVEVALVTGCVPTRTAPVALDAAVNGRMPREQRSPRENLPTPLATVPVGVMQPRVEPQLCLAFKLLVATLVRFYVSRRQKNRHFTTSQEDFDKIFFHTTNMDYGYEDDKLPGESWKDIGVNG